MAIVCVCITRGQTAVCAVCGVHGSKYLEHLAQSLPHHWPATPHYEVSGNVNYRYLGCIVWGVDGCVVCVWCRGMVRVAGVVGVGSAMCDHAHYTRQ